MFLWDRLSTTDQLLQKNSIENDVHDPTATARSRGGAGALQQLRIWLANLHPIATQSPNGGTKIINHGGSHQTIRADGNIALWKTIAFVDRALNQGDARRTGSSEVWNAVVR